MNIKYIIILMLVFSFLFILWPKKSQDIKIGQDILTSPICPGDPDCCVNTLNKELDIIRR